jgi:VWFA-related protein
VTTRRPWLFVILVTFAILVARDHQYVSAQAQQPAPQQPVFRVGTHFVSVDAYPTRDGKVIEGLTKDDFDVYEDDKPQKVETFEFISADARPPDDERSTMLTPREGLELAADPRYRVFVIVIDKTSLTKATWEPMRSALHDFLDREVSPRDLIGLITTDHSWQDLVIGERLSAIEEEIDQAEWLETQPSEESMVLDGCGLGMLRGRGKSDAVYTLLESLVRVLGQVREDHSSIVFVSNNITRQPKDSNGTGQERTYRLPNTALINGRISRVNDDTHDRACKAEAARLDDINFDQRFSALATSARASNVSFYPIRMPALVPDLRSRAMFSAEESRRPTSTQTRFPPPPEDNLGELAKKTDGFPVAMHDGLGKGLQRISQDVGAHYLLGYYTSNDNWDGKIRRITVRLKPKGTQIAARHEYRAPTKAEMEALSASRDVTTNARSAAVADALGTLSHARPSAQFYAYGAVHDRTMTVAIEVPDEAVDAGRFGDGGTLEMIADTAEGETVGSVTSKLLPNGRALVTLPLDGAIRPATLFVRLRADGEAITERVTVTATSVALAGDPVLYRSGPRGSGVPVASFLFTHQDRMRVEWPVADGVAQYDVRLLDQFGHPLQMRPDVRPQDTSAGKRLIADLSLAPLGKGDYVVELTVKAGDTTEQKLTAFRMR